VLRDFGACGLDPAVADAVAAAGPGAACFEDNVVLVLRGAGKGTSR
jgi:hypothetical protein